MLFFERTVKNMNHKKFTNTYDDGNIPDVDFPKDSVKNTAKDSFSSKYHEAVSTISNPEKESGEITKVYMKGYKYKDKVLRPSMVEVISNE